MQGENTKKSYRMVYKVNVQVISVNMEERKIDLGAMGTTAEEMRTTGQTVMFVLVEGALAGLIGVADPIKATSADAIRDLHAKGIRIVMVNGARKPKA